MADRPVQPASNDAESTTHRLLFWTLSMTMRFALTFFYSGAYKHDTLHPIKLINKKQHYRESEQNRLELIDALANFKHLKNKELDFVSRAATIAAAAVVAVFSWPSAEHTIWMAKMLWHWSFIASAFSLIGLAHQRLLRHLPEPRKKDSDTDKTKFADADIELALNLFLTPSTSPTDGGKVKKQHVNRTVSGSMLWVWQCPLMLVSYAWVLFLLGYGLHVLTPVFDPSLKEVTKAMAIATLCGAAIPLGNFFFCAALCQFRLRRWTDDRVTNQLKDAKAGDK